MQVKAYNERKCLAVSLTDAKTAIEELNRVSSALVLVVIVIVWLLLMEITTTRVLVFIFSQMLLVVFMFGNTIKTLFEAMIFVFIVHPFDVGDRCVVDGVMVNSSASFAFVHLLFHPVNLMYSDLILENPADGSRRDEHFDHDLSESRQ